MVIITLVTNVYTDGSVFNNQRNKSKKVSGGVGVYFGDNDDRNISISYVDDNNKITNNRTELVATIMAIDNFKKSLQYGDNLNRKLVINSDSEYVINCITKWINKWKMNKWKTSGNKNVMNKDLIMKLDSLIINSNFRIQFKHVRAHKCPPIDKYSDEYRMWYGNMMADKFAKDGSRKKLNKILS